MNAKRRAALDDIKSRIEALVSELETQRDDEQEAFDNMPEGLQMSARGDALQDNISNLDNAIDNLNDAVSDIEAAVE
ncbi:hypothetical protein [Inquilinus limosus]|uniref:hypothetical protein n=1 Tax=Inquilinus limosus TaxID=171674 RepID=UPI00047EA375|nr:hypothetical protein [Inquilinus limosus]